MRRAGMGRRHEEYEDDEPYVVVERKEAGITRFRVGLAVAAGLALLFAPQSGVETRREIRRRARRAQQTVREATGELTDSMVDRYEQAKRNVEDKIESARQALEFRKRQAA